MTFKSLEEAMTKEKIQEFSALQAEPTWLTDLRLKAFDKIAELDLPVIERVKFHRWNLGDGSLATNDEIGAVPDFTFPLPAQQLKTRTC
ncbi:hypothetical protein LI88_10160 [Streptococcus suis]|nr:hypothetical protein LI88_10160 [Streptococcus suis]